MSSNAQKAGRAGTGGGYVTVEMCEDWGERYERVDGRSMRDIAEADSIPESTVRDHIIGRCKHAPAQRGVHDIRDSEDREAVLNVLESMLDRNYGDTVHTSSSRVKGFAAADLQGQKVRAVLADLTDRDWTPRGLTAERNNPDANTARYALTRVERGDGE